MIEIILTCTVEGCGRKSEPFEATHVDSYDFHDFPSDSVVVSPPQGWWHETLFNDDVVCPDHYDEYIEWRRTSTREEHKRGFRAPPLEPRAKEPF